MAILSGTQPSPSYWTAGSIRSRCRSWPGARMSAWRRRPTPTCRRMRLGGR